MRREFTRAVKRAAFARAGGCCEGTLPGGERCGATLRPGHYTFDHDVPDWMGGEPTLGNCRCLCDPCDERKYHSDRAVIDKTKNRLDRHIGIKKKPKGRPMPGTRASGIRKRFDGKVERWPLPRNTGRAAG